MMKELATQHSATSFFNSLFLEWNEFSYDGKSLRMPLVDEELIIPVEKFSRVGRHKYEGKFYSKTLNQDQKEISFEDAAEKIVNFLSGRLNANPKVRDHFIGRIRNSVSSMAKIMSYREEDLRTLSVKDMNFIKAERLLYAGHTFHPTPKARQEFSEENAVKYSPEMSGEFPLFWFFVHESILKEKQALGFSDLKWLENIFTSEFPEKTIPEGFRPYPVHPFQKEILARNQSIQSYLTQGKLIEAGTSQTFWSATSSLRTLYNRSATYMLKFSVSVKLTNSLRNLLARELDRGLTLYKVFHEKKTQEILKDFPQFELIHEPVFCGIKNVAGELIEESLFLGRVNSIQEGNDTLLVGALAMDHPFYQENLLHQYIRKISVGKELSLKEASLLWFKEFYATALEPLIALAGVHGLLLGSHQQNMLITLKDGMPIKSYFRDCNGTGFTHKGAKELNGEGIVLDETSAAYLFGYYVIINTALNVIASIAHAGWTSEDELLSLFKSLLNKTESQYGKSYLTEYLLHSEFLMHKGNFLCSLNNINENTATNPLSIYCRIQNPLYMRNAL